MRGARGRLGAVAAAAVVVAMLPGVPTASAARVSGSVGPYQFSTAARTGESATCTTSHGLISKISARSPRVKMRAYWTKPHNGRVASAQYVSYTVTLMGLRGRTWTKVASRHEDVLVKNRWTRLPAVSAFAVSASHTKYSAFHVNEALTWLRPTDNSREGSVHTQLTHYHSGTRWVSACSTGLLPVNSVHAVATSDHFSLSWHNPSMASYARTVVRYTKGSTAPDSPSRGTKVTLAKNTAVTISRLQQSTRYAFSIWAVNNAGHYSRRVTGTVLTKVNRPPLGVPSVNASASGTTVSWTVSVDPGGYPATVQVTSSHGYNQTFSTGTTSWTSPGMAENVGWSTNDTIWVTVSSAGRASTSGSGGATTGAAPPPPPPPATVSVSRGAACGSRCSGCSGCQYIHVATANFGGNVTCTFNSQHGGGFVNATYGPNDSHDSPNWYGYPGSWVSATCGGVTGQTTW